jgi:hypothetical protein
VAEAAAADRLAQSFRGIYEPTAEGKPSDAGVLIADARVAAERAEAAVALLEGEALAAQRQLDAAQERVPHTVLDVLKSEILRLGREAAGLDHVAAQIRSNLEQAGYVTANFQRRHHLVGTAFTASTRAAMYRDPNARPPAPSVNWAGFVERLMVDAEAVLE